MTRRLYVNETDIEMLYIAQSLLLNVMSILQATDEAQHLIPDIHHVFKRLEKYADHIEEGELKWSQLAEEETDD